MGSPDTDLGDQGYRLGRPGIPTWEGDPEALKGERLSRLDADPLIVAAVADLLGVEVGATFACLLPGHEPKPGTARLWRDESGLVVYRDLHAVGGIRALTLAEVYAARVSRRTRRRKGPEHVTWKLRLLYHVGYLRPADVVLPPLSPSASRAARQLRVGFALLHGLRQLREPGAATAFTKRFAADWCRLSEPTAYGGIRELLAEGVLVIDHADQSRRGFRPTPYYLPGGAS